MKSLIVYFSRTDCVAKLAECLRLQLAPLGEVVIERIEPIRKHSYWGWLACSFLPGWRVRIRPVITELVGYDLVCIGFPKWTLSCPPANQYIASMRLAPSQRVGIFMSYGGFDEKRYLRGMVKKIAAKGARIVSVTSIKRSTISDGRFEEAIEGFSRQLLTHS